MNYKNSPVYAQRQIDEILKEFRDFAKAYIDDVVIFSTFLTEHLKHLEKVFSLFEKFNVALKPSKTFLKYSTITLLRQKIDSFEMSTSIEKLKTILRLKFPLTLSHLEIYLKKTEYLRQYVLYYAQKAEPLMQRKTMLLKLSSNIKKKARKNFSKRTDIIKSSKKEWDFFKQLQMIFSRSSFFIHYDAARFFYVDVNDSKKREFGVMIFHVKKRKVEESTLIIPSSRTEMKSIMFMSKILSDAKKKY